MSGAVVAAFERLPLRWQLQLWWLLWLWYGRDITDDVFVQAAACMHLIGVAEHLGVRLLASPPSRALDNEELFVIEG